MPTEAFTLFQFKASLTIWGLKLHRNVRQIFELINKQMKGKTGLEKEHCTEETSAIIRTSLMADV